jgi:hypothetical protein
MLLDAFEYVDSTIHGGLNIVLIVVVNLGI